MEWQPIETAPRDGTTILVWQKGSVEFARWNTGPWNKMPRPFWDGTLAALWGKMTARNHPPTHWMPLPPPPAE